MNQCGGVVRPSAIVQNLRGQKTLEIVFCTMSVCVWLLMCGGVK